MKALRAVSKAQVAKLDLPNVVAVAFSPKSTYLTTFQRPQPSAGNTEKNLKVRSLLLSCHLAHQARCFPL